MYDVAIVGVRPAGRRPASDACGCPKGPVRSGILRFRNRWRSTTIFPVLRRFSTPTSPTITAGSVPVRPRDSAVPFAARWPWPYVRGSGVSRGVWALRANVLLKNRKRRVVFNPTLRKAVMRSGDAKRQDGGLTVPRQRTDAAARVSPDAPADREVSGAFPSDWSCVPKAFLA